MMLLTMTFRVKEICPLDSEDSSGIREEVDIQTSAEQKIIEVIRILLENQVLSEFCNDDLNCIRIFSERKKEYISPFLTLQQAGILHGEVLIILRERQRDEEKFNQHN